MKEIQIGKSVLLLKDAGSRFSLKKLQTGDIGQITSNDNSGITIQMDNGVEARLFGDTFGLSSQFDEFEEYFDYTAE